MMLDFMMDWYLVIGIFVFLLNDIGMRFIGGFGGPKGPLTVIGIVAAWPIFAALMIHWFVMNYIWYPIFGYPESQGH